MYSRVACTPCMYLLRLVAERQLRMSVSGVARSRMGRVGAAILAVTATAALLAGCTIDNGGTDSSAASTTKAAPEKPEVSVKNGAVDVNPAEPVTIKMKKARLKEVTMTNQEGKVVAAELASDGKSWTTAEELGFYRDYTIDAVTSEGEKVHTTFSTVKPAAEANVALSPIPESVVGIGQTVSFQFGVGIPNRKAVQDAITITTEPKVEGAFYWISDSVLRWRPENFWEPGTQVTVDAKLYGVDLGEGVYGGLDNQSSFTVGDSVIAEVDDATKIMTISRGGEQVNSMPVSMGSAKFPTPNGTYVVGDRNPQMVMDSSTYGLDVNSADGYRTDVQFATQLSWSGIYVHAAPWSTWAQGSQNVSHGCINVSTANAQWFQDNVKRGDVVIIRNTIGGELSGYDRLGDWNIPWETWKAGNADK